MQYWGLPLLLVMSRYGRPGVAQSGAMEVVTLDPPTTAAAATSSTADAQATASVVPSLLYPVGNPVLNNIDSLSVNYVTPWPVVDLVVSCGVTTEDTDTSSFKAENLPQDGPYDLSPIQQSLNPSQYPLYCHIALKDASNSQNIIDSGQFIMTSTGGSPTRYAQSTTAALPASASSVVATSTRIEPTGSASSTLSTSNDSSSSRTSRTVNISSNPTAAPASATSTAPSSSSRSSGGLSSGTKAAIAISVLIFLALLALFILLLFRYHRKLQRTQSELHEIQASAAAAAAAHANEKAYLDSILKVAGKPETSQGGRIIVADLGSRQSSDWKQFFASKADSARQAISNVGSRGNSRPGSRKTSRPATANEPPVPDVPSLPSPSLVESTRGDGSTVGLVSGEKEGEGAKRSVKLVNSVRRKPVPSPR